VLVLSSALIVSVIGLSALLAMRVQRLRAADTNDLAQARLYAQAAIEMGLHWIESDPNWRDSWPNGVWATDVPAGDGTFTLEGTDPDALPLNDDPNEPLTLTGTGVAGEARYKLQVALTAQLRGLGCLEVALHVAGGVNLNAMTLTCNQTVSTNNSIMASTATGTSDLEAVGTIDPGAIVGTQTIMPNTRALPDTTVFDFYTDPLNGTPINIADIPRFQGQAGIRLTVLSPNSNPYGSGQTNPLGIYFIDCQGEVLTIQDVRIVGTLVLLNAGSGSEVRNFVNWEPAVPNFPALLVQGPMYLNFNSTVTLSEGTLSTNFNPPSTPYLGTSDIVQDDSYPSIINGLVYVSSFVTISTGDPALNGVLVVGGVLATSVNLSLTYQETFLNNPPPGFGGQVTMFISPGSWMPVVD
jgi:hypothetical protein